MRPDSLASVLTPVLASTAALLAHVSPSVGERSGPLLSIPSAIDSFKRSSSTCRVALPDPDPEAVSFGDALDVPARRPEDRD